MFQRVRTKKKENCVNIEPSDSVTYAYSLYTYTNGDQEKIQESENRWGIFT